MWEIFYKQRENKLKVKDTKKCTERYPVREANIGRANKLV